MSTILITGASSGFGLETAHTFLERGWAVIASMRNPREDLLPASEHLRILPLDVTDADSITRAVELAGSVDALVNNAGGGLMGALAGTSIASKAAVEAVSAGLALEVEPFGIRVHLVLPGRAPERRSAPRRVGARRPVSRKPMPVGPSKRSPPLRRAATSPRSATSQKRSGRR